MPGCADLEQASAAIASSIIHAMMSNSQYPGYAAQPVYAPPKQAPNLQQPQHQQQHAQPPIYVPGHQLHSGHFQPSQQYQNVAQYQTTVPQQPPQQPQQQPQQQAQAYYTAQLQQLYPHQSQQEQRSVPLQTVAPSQYGEGQASQST
jgi:hypothetical protein